APRRHRGIEPGGRSLVAEIHEGPEPPAGDFGSAAAGKKENNPAGSGHYHQKTVARARGQDMAAGRVNTVLRHLKAAACLPGGGGVTDAQLLEQYLAHRSEGAFEALLRRHGPMVLGVCLRVLRNDHDAEDAFQATSLVCVRKGGSIARRGVLASWLYGVAYRTSLKARAMSAKRRVKERAAGQRARPEAPADPAACDLQAVLDQELNRLPEKY